MRLACCLLVSLASVAHAQSQDLGHRIPGAVGLDAGTQATSGLYLADRFVWFAANRVNDRHGDMVPIEALDIDAYSNVFGVAGTIEVGELYLGAAVSAPIVKSTLSSDRPEVSIDRLGLGNVFIQPLQVGHRFERLDTVASYSFYIPTRQGARTGVGQPEWSHQFSAGGTLFFDDRRGSRFSLLASYLKNHRKREIDITRGDTISLQGGIGGRMGILDFGIAGYALWQVNDDRGADLPDMLRGARDRVFGLGPEIDVTLPSLRSRLTARFEWDFGAQARPVGRIFLLGLTVIAWMPSGRST